MRPMISRANGQNMQRIASSTVCLQSSRAVRNRKKLNELLTEEECV
jgi:hypothetical protein